MFSSPNASALHVWWALSQDFWSSVPYSSLVLLCSCAGPVVGRRIQTRLAEAAGSKGRKQEAVNKSGLFYLWNVLTKESGSRKAVKGTPGPCTHTPVSSGMEESISCMLAVCLLQGFLPRFDLFSVLLTLRVLALPPGVSFIHHGNLGHLCPARLEALLLVLATMTN